MRRNIFRQLNEFVTLTLTCWGSYRRIVSLRMRGNAPSKYFMQDAEKSLGASFSEWDASSQMCDKKEKHTSQSTHWSNVFGNRTTWNRGRPRRTRWTISPAAVSPSVIPNSIYQDSDSYSEINHHFTRHVRCLIALILWLSCLERRQNKIKYQKWRLLCKYVFPSSCEMMLECHYKRFSSHDMHLVMQFAKKEVRCRFTHVKECLLSYFFTSLETRYS